MSAIDGALTLGAVVLAVVAVRPLPSVPAPFSLPWPVLALFFVAAEWWRVYLHFRRSAHSLSLSEVPLVIGLFLTSPIGLVLARVVGGAIGLGLLRRQPPIKLVFNLSLFGIEAAVATLLAHALVPRSEPVGPSAWVGVFVIVGLVGAIGSLAVMLAISVSEGPPPARQVLEGFGLGLVVALANASIALEVVAVVWRDPRQLWLLFVPIATTVIAYGAYTGERQKHQRMQHLYASRDLLQPAADIQTATAPLLAQLCQVFRAEMAELIMLPDGDSGEVAVIRVADGQPTRSTQHVDHVLLQALIQVTTPEPHGVLLTDTDIEGAAELLAARGVRDGMLAPLRTDSRVLGTLLVGGRMGDLNSFDLEDLQLLETLAAQASVSMHNWRLDDQLKYQAFHDPLTGLANRTLFTERLTHGLSRRGGDQDGRTAVLFVDLDDFKMVNDSLGHAAGDDVLRAVAERIRAAVRSFDTPARLGGDEFAILLEDLDTPADAVEVAQRVVHALQEPIVIQGKDVAMHASVGIATASDGAGPEELLRQADVAMYRAKERGKATFEVYEESMRQVVERRLELKTDLERALPRAQLFLQYQPIVALRGGRIVGVEALLRWQHPERGIVAPDSFVSLAEETGLIIPIGRYVLEQACTQARAWGLRFPRQRIGICVNLSPRQLHQRSFVADVQRVLRQTGLDPELLTLEITEGIMVDGSEATMRQLHELRDMGIRLAIDDFGTGYSSLSSLHDLPVDTLKIAKAFTDGVAEDKRKRAFVKAIVTLGKNLHMKLIAEGVERSEQRDQLRDLGCDLGQGYYFARPVDADAVVELLARQSPSGPEGSADSGRILRLPA